MLDDGRGVCCPGVSEGIGSSHRVRSVAPRTTRRTGLTCSTDPKPFPASLISTLLASLQGLLNGTRQPLWEVAAQVLGAVLGSKQFRAAVWKEENCISG